MFTVTGIIWSFLPFTGVIVWRQMLYTCCTVAAPIWPHLTSWPLQKYWLLGYSVLTQKIVSKVSFLFCRQKRFMHGQFGYVPLCRREGILLCTCQLDPPSIHISHKRNSPQTDKLILMKLYTVVVYQRRKFKGDNYKYRTWLSFVIWLTVLVPLSIIQRNVMLRNMHSLF